jgi:hypothetical protein
MFYSLLELTGVHDLRAEIVVRKFYIVYGHPLLAALMLGLVVLAFRRDRILAMCLGGAGPYVFLGVLFVGASNTRYGPWLATLSLILWLLLLRPVIRTRGLAFAIYLVFAGLYVAVVGALFFNIPALSHAQFHWSALQYATAMSWSLGLAVIPAGALYLVTRLSQSPKSPTRNVCFLMVPVFHTAMAAFYLAMRAAVE